MPVKLPTRPAGPEPGRAVPQRSGERPSFTARRSLILALACVTAALAAGCHRNTPRAASDIFNFSLNFPVPLKSASPDALPPEPPEIALAYPASQPLTLVIPAARPVPPRPRTSASEPEPEATKPEAPTLSPQLSPNEQAAAERDTRKDILAAEGNLQVAYGKQLNSAQKDLAEKIRGFVAQSREAMRASDWVRARNLAQKARVLSIELINSL